MRFFLWLCAVILLFCVVGCQHTKPRVTTVPSPKVTRTVTETVKVETPVPVYEKQTVITTHTKTLDGHGNSAPDLHKTEIVKPPEFDKAVGR